MQPYRPLHRQGRKGASIDDTTKRDRKYGDSGSWNTNRRVNKSGQYSAGGFSSDSNLNTAISSNSTSERIDSESNSNKNARSFTDEAGVGQNTVTEKVTSKTAPRFGQGGSSNQGAVLSLLKDEILHLESSIIRAQESPGCSSTQFALISIEHHDALIAILNRMRSVGDTVAVSAYYFTSLKVYVNAVCIHRTP